MNALNTVRRHIAGLLPDRRAVERPTLNDPRAERELTEHGFTVIRALDARGVAAALAVNERLGAAPDDPGVAINWSFHSSSADHKRAVHDALRSAVGSEVDALLDLQVPYLASFITKWPGPNSAFTPHQDPSLVDERRFRGVTVWIALEPIGVAGVDNGMLRFVPGSHRFSDDLRPSDVDTFAYSDNEDAIIAEFGIGVPLEPGEALVFDNRVIHFSMPNDSDRPRVVASFGVRPAEASCVLLRHDGAGRYRIHEIDDDYYLTVPPVLMHEHQPSSPPIGVVSIGGEKVSEREFSRLCRRGPGIPTSVRRPVRGARPRQDPGAFCAHCGSMDGLEERERTDRNNAQLICAACAEGLLPVFEAPSQA